MVDIDRDLVLLQLTVGGAPEGIACPSLPSQLEKGASESIVCGVTNGDGSKGDWHFKVSSDSTVVGQWYEETVPTPYTKEKCTNTPDEGQFQKDSTRWTAQCLHFYAAVFQFDANTGPCSFLGHYGSSAHNRSYRFSDAIIRVDGGDQCSLLGPIVEDSLVEVWAVAKGVESYSTTMGGTNTYTVFEVIDIIAYK